jgi:hypothetical protein
MWVYNKLYHSLVTIEGRGKDRTPNGMGDTFDDLWMLDLLYAQVIRASYLLESNTSFNQWNPSLGVCVPPLIDPFFRSFGCFLECGLFEPEQEG